MEACSGLELVGSLNTSIPICLISPTVVTESFPLGKGTGDVAKSSKDAPTPEFAYISSRIFALIC